ncbi:transmembrane glycoprotein NMB [Tachyglossus aculeatus]|uniref:transmembrane glycoprotein NMB n=1 Tax=Tachyglossus aculeatus TaxID=9261 RepID=UPI0018F3E99C|nr:transmembrane glycoprotein NMB [Tachyglossus aculeatus]
MRFPPQLLGLLFLATGMTVAAAKRFQDVMSRGRGPTYGRHHNQLEDWSSDQNQWDEKLYPFWKEGDPRWNNCWKGGRVQAILTSDSPALVGSKVTFTVTLKYPRCQEEDEFGNIVYEKSCRNGSSPDPYVYNWTAWIDDSGKRNPTNKSDHNVFPDGRPFPHHPGWRRKNFVYIFHTLGQYFQIMGRSTATISVNTANVSLGLQLMEVTVYRRGFRAFIPIASTKDIYEVTDQIPIFVNVSQKNNRNASDDIFIKDLPITFDVLVHDPSHYLNASAIYYKWDFGDSSGLFVSNNPVSTHTYTLKGNFSLNLTVQAAVPGPCQPITPSSPTPTPTPGQFSNSTPQMHSDANLLARKKRDVLYENCQINRYGHFQAEITIVEGILEVNIIQMTNVQMPTAQGVNSLIDFVVTCQGSTPTDVCTTVSDPTCLLPQTVVCDPVEVDDECLLTVRRAFNESGTYCMNIALGDEASLALASTLVSISGGAPVSSSRIVEGVLISVGFLTMAIIVITLFVHRRYKEYKPIERSPGKAVSGKRLNVYFNNVKAVFFRGDNEKNPLLKTKAGVV